jgi:hypothetical protein
VLGDFILAELSNGRDDGVWLAESVIPFVISDEDRFLAYLYAYCDESGKQDDHLIVVFSSLVDGFENWRRFGDKWAALLRRFHLTSFHAVKAMRYSQPYGTLQPSDATQRARDLLPFAEAIVDGVEFGAIVAIDVGAYKSKEREDLRLNVSEDPHYFAFFIAVSKIVGHWIVPRNHTVGLILDDDEGKSIDCYKFLLRMKRANIDVRNRVTSICFSDDKSSPQVQAADLFACLARLRAQETFVGRTNEYASLCEVFDRKGNQAKRLIVDSSYLQKADLQDFVNSRKTK